MPCAGPAQIDHRPSLVSSWVPHRQAFPEQPGKLARADGVEQAREYDEVDVELPLLATAEVISDHGALPASTPPDLVFIAQSAAFGRSAAGHRPALAQRTNRSSRRCPTPGCWIARQCSRAARPDDLSCVGRPPATPTDTATAARPSRRCSSLAASTWRSPSAVSHELLNSKHKSSSLAGIARTAASGVEQQPARDQCQALRRDRWRCGQR
jgi:hypothetical protein